MNDKKPLAFFKSNGEPWTKEDIDWILKEYPDAKTSDEFTKNESVFNRKKKYFYKRSPSKKIDFLCWSRQEPKINPEKFIIIDICKEKPLPNLDDVEDILKNF